MGVISSVVVCYLWGLLKVSLSFGGWNKPHFGRFEENGPAMTVVVDGVSVDITVAFKAPKDIIDIQGRRLMEEVAEKVSSRVSSRVSSSVSSFWPPRCLLGGSPSGHPSVSPLRGFPRVVPLGGLPSGVLEVSPRGSPPPGVTSGACLPPGGSPGGFHCGFPWGAPLRGSHLRGPHDVPRGFPRGNLHCVPQGFPREFPSSVSKGSGGFSGTPRALGDLYSYHLLEDAFADVRFLLQ